MSNRSNKEPLSRRRWVQQLGATAATLLVPGVDHAAETSLRVAGQDVEIQIAPLSPHTFRLSVVPIHDGKPAAIPDDGILAPTAWKNPVTRLHGAVRAQTVKAGDLKIQVAPDPLSFTILTANGETVQQLKIDRTTGVVSFATGSAPLLGLGEGGPQFDRRGLADRMRSGQGGYQLRTHGGRVPVPWIVGTAGWAIFIHQPYGSFDFTGPESKFVPATTASALPLDLFFVASKDPATIMAEYARLTGYPALPPLWSF